MYFVRRLRFRYYDFRIKVVRRNTTEHTHKMINWNEATRISIVSSLEIIYTKLQQQ